HVFHVRCRFHLGGPIRDTWRLGAWKAMERLAIGEERRSPSLWVGGCVLPVAHLPCLRVWKRPVSAKAGEALRARVRRALQAAKSRRAWGRGMSAMGTGRVQPL